MGLSLALRSVEGVADGPGQPLSRRPPCAAGCGGLRVQTRGRSGTPMCGLACANTRGPQVGAGRAGAVALGARMMYWRVLVDHELDE